LPHDSNNLRCIVDLAFFMPGEAVKLQTSGNTDDMAQRIYAQAVLQF